MSSDGSASSKDTSEQDVEIQQVESEASNRQLIVVVADIERVPDNGYDGADSAAADASDLAAESVNPQGYRQEDSAIRGTGVEDSQESTLSSFGSGTESQLGDGTRCVTRKTSLESSASVGDNGTESQEGCGNRTELKYLYETGGPSKRDSPDSAAVGSSSSSGSYETALAGDSSSRTSSNSGVTEGVSSNLLSTGSSASAIESYEGIASSAPSCSAAGDFSGRTSLNSGVTGGVSSNPVSMGSSASAIESYEGIASSAPSCSAAGDFSSRTSLNSGVTGGIPRNPVSTGSSAGAMGFCEGIASSAPSCSAAAAVAASEAGSQSGRRSPEVTLIQNADGESQEEVAGNCEQCLTKCASACDFLKPCARYVRSSKLYRFLKKPMLLLLSISAIGMGAAYHNHCPNKVVLPAYFIEMGAVGIFLVAFSFASDLRASLCPHINKWYFMAAIGVAVILFIWTFADALITTYLSTPSFDPSDLKNYCDMVFYYYAFYINIVIMGFIVLAAFLYIPTINDDVPGYEQL